jgi:hypothetical protein
VLVLCDIDHCISDARWRDELIGRVSWHEYHAEQTLDPPASMMIQAVNGLVHLGHRVVHLTARPETWRPTTLRWMLRHAVMSDGLIMRPDDDYTPMADLKIRQAQEAFGMDLAEVGLVIDDKEAVLERFRAIGVCTLQVTLGALPCPIP